MKNYYLLFPALLLAGCLGYTQSEPQQQQVSTLNETLLDYNEHINEDFLYQHLSVIAHDSLEGRETGMPGQKKAARYLADFYSNLGFEPKGDDGYYQYFNLDAEQTDSLVYITYHVEGDDTLKISHSTSSETDSADFLRLFGGAEAMKGQVAFAGFGVNDPVRNVNHLDGVDLSGKWVLIFNDIPHVVDGDTLVNPAISGNQRIGMILNQMDANGVLVITDHSAEEFEERSQIASELLTKPFGMRLQYLDSQSSAGFPKGYLQISPGKAAKMLGLDHAHQLESLRENTVSNIQDFEARDLPFLIDYTPYQKSVEVETENILAYLEGSDPELKDEVVVLMAHYDHIGITQPNEAGDQINNGADDDGSGTVGLMAIAEAFSHAAEEGTRPRRSILFLHVSGEEKGLLGSRYYSDHPVISIEKTVANFNADMIGRSDPENIEKGDTDYIYIIGGEIISSELDSLVHAANDKSVNMRLDYRYNDLRDPNQFYRRSDHWNFGRLEVPFVFFFTGVHEDYHRPSDTVDKIDFPKLTRTTRLIYASTIKTANWDNRPTVDNEEFIEITRSQPR